MNLPPFTQNVKCCHKPVTISRWVINSDTSCFTLILHQDSEYSDQPKKLLKVHVVDPLFSFKHITDTHILSFLFKINLKESGLIIRFKMIFSCILSINYYKRQCCENDANPWYTFLELDFSRIDKKGLLAINMCLFSCIEKPQF